MSLLSQPKGATQGQKNTANQVVGKFPGKCLERADGKWKEQCFDEFRQEVAVS